MATADALMDGKWKTMLIYKIEDGLAIRRVHVETKVCHDYPVSSAEMDAIQKAWPDLKQRLADAGVQSVKRSTNSPLTNKVS